MAKAKPIPEGFTTITPHLVCADAAGAIEYYKRAFGAVEVARLDMPDSKVVAHAELRIGNAVFMIGEECPEHGALGPKALKGSPVNIHLYVDDVDAVVAQAVRLGAKVTMPVSDMFWGDRYGTLEDPYGHRWGVATHQREVPPKEMEQAMRKMMAEERSKQPA